MRIVSEARARARAGLPSLTVGLLTRIPHSAGGKGGIRTHGTVSRTQHFQCCQFSHSCTFPHTISDCGFRIANLRNGSSIGQSAIRNPKSEILSGGEGGIRTHGGVSPTPVFETGLFNQLQHLSVLVNDPLFYGTNAYVPQ